MFNTQIWGIDGTSFEKLNIGITVQRPSLRKRRPCTQELGEKARDFFRTRDSPVSFLWMTRFCKACFDKMTCKPTAVLICFDISYKQLLADC